MEEKNSEVIAINKKQLQESDFCEWLVATVVKRARIAFLTMIACVSLIILISLIASLYGAHVIDGKMILLLIICVLIAVLCRFVLPKWLGKIRYRQHLTITKGIDDRRIVFYQDHLAFIVDKTVTNQFSYSDIQRTILTKNLYILQFPNRVSCMLRRDGFIEGSLEIVQKQITGFTQGNE
ncbi:hypothetical protein [Caproiciproducens faecalis]|uniref:YcxB-like protein domain-containing protein n=1 Tax=Caproiciproducens faecalis TaxID=2820301 RepID=A0ABS7DL42_9FIRM|nr:hypothetical protein [Caproiciproducens faecalis]MBW7572014.1 hypothetical protein [Caproiciproducens faecalis]